MSSPRAEIMLPDAFQQPPPSYPQHVHSPKFEDFKTDVHVPSQSAQAYSTEAKSAPGLQPYLGLSARLCLSVLSPCLIALLFSGAQLWLSAQDIDEKVEHAKIKLVDACLAAEQQVSVAASMPRYLADGMNQRTKEAVEATVSGLGRTLNLTLVALEAILLFVIDSYRSMFLCFIELLVRGSLSLLMSAVDLTDQVINDAGHGVKKAIQVSVDGINSFLHGALDSANDLLSIIGKTIAIPVIPQPDLSALDNVHLPATFDEGLRKLNTTLPTLTDLRDKMDRVIQGPFAELKTDVNSTVSAFRFNAELLPLPAAQTVRFCDELDVSSLDDLGKGLKRMIHFGLIALATCIVLLILVNAFHQWWTWKVLQRQLATVQRNWQQLQDEDGYGSALPNRVQIFRLIEAANHPLATMLGAKIMVATKIRSISARDRIDWWISFVAHPMALTVLATGMMGFITIQAQIWALPGVQKQAQSHLQGSVADLSRTAAAKVNALTMTASRDFADRTNAVIFTAQDDLNAHMFGWMNSTIGTLNATLNEFADGIAMALNDSFANTPLYTPIQTFVSCILLQKVTKIEEALTWLHDHAHAEFPTVAPTILMLSTNMSQELIRPVQESIVGGETASSRDNGLVPTLITSYEGRLKTQRLLSLVLLGLYAVVCVIGTLVASLYPCASQQGRKKGFDDDGQTSMDRENEEKKSQSFVDNGVQRSHDSISAPLSPERMVLYRPYISKDDQEHPSEDDSSKEGLLAKTGFQDSSAPMNAFVRVHESWQEQQKAALSQQHSEAGSSDSRRGGRPQRALLMTTGPAPPIIVDQVRLADKTAAESPTPTSHSIRESTRMPEGFTLVNTH